MQTVKGMKAKKGPVGTPPPSVPLDHEPFDMTTVEQQSSLVEVSFSKELPNILSTLLLFLVYRK